ncbi:hypothetical protein DES52_13110 [Deinococcus yavapaiensis KR-236]|uniref:Uncharacterized protein n=1 Tax=Deinococcus yavapaiensis KR-236 TaxID=694435 RepID=A0A318RYZ5_9DEIO|nr:hypothetical protein DES52_13110 [Deinococcus yavapaiensis KR-236]
MVSTNAAGNPGGQTDVERSHLLEALDLVREMGHPGWTAVVEAALNGQYVSPVFNFEQ